MFQPDDEITIRYEDFENLMADVAVDLSDAFGKIRGENWQKAMFHITALYSAELCKALYKRQEAENGKV